ncbi:hypothetical protein [Burkholderia gladioli]|uniref:hypothetical protein n=1 Tax=Burkholderia gladioli TaxID=28095 RepID=UPI00163ECFAB|nr:hypothetical protein [Burkholderia gladioli]
MFKIQTRQPNAAGTRLGPWKDLRFSRPFATEQQAREAAAALDQDGVMDDNFVRVVPA